MKKRKLRLWVKIAIVILIMIAIIGCIKYTQKELELCQIKGNSYSTCVGLMK